MPSTAASVDQDVHSPSRFGRFELRPDERVLLAEGAPVALGARAFDVLAVLVHRAGKLVTKNDLLNQVWPGLVVEENNLQVQVSTLRKLLGPSAVATIPGRGYRFDLALESAGRASAAAVAASAGSPPAAGHSGKTNLPGRLPTLFGRGDDLAKITALLERHAVVTIVGAGGIGKTRVAQAVAAELVARYPDGVWWVELAAISDPSLVPSAVARALGAQLPADRPAIETLISILAPQRALLVLDNCEHLADAAADLVAQIAAAAPRVGMLVTSQETLKASDEQIYRLGALAIPSTDDVAAARHAGAVELLVARAQAVDPRFALTAENAATAVEICRRLDGIPLAIELAAARMPLLGLEGLRARLDERFNLLTAGARVVLRRHQTLRATLEWSHALLTRDEQTVFRRLGVFAGSFTLEAAQHVVRDAQIDAWSALDHLGALVDKSLVLAEGDPVPRYRLLETTRAYALERLTEAEETQHILRRHAQALIVVLAEFEREGVRWTMSLAQYAAASAELDNLRAALVWTAASPAAADLVVPLLSRSRRVWVSNVQQEEGLGWCARLRERVDDNVLAEDAAMYWLTVATLGLYTRRRECYEAALKAAELFAQLGDDDRRFDALVTAAIQGVRFASAEQMGTLIAEATRLDRPEGPPRRRTGLMFARYRWNDRLGHDEEALACALEQAAISRNAGFPLGELYAMSNVTAMEVKLGRAEEALAHAQSTIEALDAMGAGAGAGHLCGVTMRALIDLDRLDQAMAGGRKAYALLLREGDHLRILVPLALCIGSQGRLEDAARLRGAFDAAQARDGLHAEAVGKEWGLERLDALLEAGVTTAELAALRAEGEAMREDDAFKLGFGARG
jgi:predicted ATPase/DNA-binding winged helix-turn-helix (wHTH) protein